MTRPFAGRPGVQDGVDDFGLVTAIAAYHYYRIFKSWESAFEVRNGVLTVTGIAFNDA